MRSVTTKQLHAAISALGYTQRRLCRQLTRRRHGPKKLRKIVEQLQAITALADQLLGPPQIPNGSVVQRSKRFCQRLGARLIRDRRPPTPDEMTEFQHHRRIALQLGRRPPE